MLDELLCFLLARSDRELIVAITQDEEGVAFLEPLLDSVAKLHHRAVALYQKDAMLRVWIEDCEVGKEFVEVGVVFFDSSALVCILLSKFSFSPKVGSDISCICPDAASGAFALDEDEEWCFLSEHEEARGEKYHRMKF